MGPPSQRINRPHASVALGGGYASVCRLTGSQRREATGAGGGGGGLWGAEYRGLTAGLVLTVTMVASEALAVVTVMPVVARDLGGLRLYGWVFSAFMLGSMVGIVAAGREADRRGPALPFVAGVVIFGGGLAVAGLAPTMPVLVAGRALQGLGAGAVPAVAYASIGRTPARAAAGPDDGPAVHRVGRPRAGRAGAERGGGPGIRLALGVPRAAPARRRDRLDRGAIAGPARAARIQAGR